ncbi:hypothetical protein B0H12DRAFT_1133781 [Mycena haematopus]|nr:hypothetical protein B0H12DRAFT_1133781 [Mycena haematopus]
MEDLDMSDAATVEKLNEELAPVFRLSVILSGGCPRGRPPWASSHVEPLNHWIEKVCSMSTAECHQRANAGDPEMIHDFALRCSDQFVHHRLSTDQLLSAAAGIELPAPNRSAAEQYWKLLLQNPRSTVYHLGIAHAQLILFTGIVTEEGHPGPSSNMKDFILAGIHAECAAQAGHGTAPNVLKLGKIFERYRYGEHREVFGQWKGFWAAVDGWVAEKQAALDKDFARKVERPSRYKCAAPQCPLEAGTGKLLRACGGKCEDAYKPRYCTKECQVADWKTHKQMCKPGLQLTIKESASTSPSAGDPCLRILRHDVAIGGGQGVRVISPKDADPNDGGQYSFNIGGIKVQTSNTALSAQQVKEFAAAMMAKQKI